MRGINNLFIQFLLIQRRVGDLTGLSKGAVNVHGRCCAFFCFYSLEKLTNEEE